MHLLPGRNAWQSGEGIKHMKTLQERPLRTRPIQGSAWGSNTPSNIRPRGGHSPLLFPHPILPHNPTTKNPS